MTAQFNPDVRNLYEGIVKKNVVHNARDTFEYLPERYGPEVPQRLIGGGRVREEVLPGNNGHYPPTEAIEENHEGGFYGRYSHPTKVGSGRKYGGVGVIRHRVEPYANELDMDYLGGARTFAPHLASKAPRLTAAIKQRILQQHPHLMEHHLAGGKIDWGKIWKGIKSTAGMVSKAAPFVAEHLAPEEYKDTIGTIGKVSGAVSGMGRGGRAPRLTNAIKQRILQQHPHLMEHHLAGGKIDWGKIWKGIKSTAGMVSKAAPFVAEHLAPEEYKDTIGTIGKVSDAVSGMGRSYMHPHQHIVHGAGFWQDFGTGFKKGFKGTTNFISKAAPIAAMVAPEFAPAIGAVGLASAAANKAMGGRHARRNAGAHLPKSGHKRNKARGDIVAAVMHQRGVSLAQASRIVKQEGLY